jgi:hypothetical protein
VTDATLTADRFAEGDFRAGHALGRAGSVLSRNFLSFFAVTAVAAMPQAATDSLGDPINFLLVQGLGPILRVEGLGPLLGHVLGTLSQAVVLYGAFQDMRGKRVSLGESMRVGLRRFFPVVGVALSTTVLGYLGLFVFVVPGLICFTTWFVATPACVVEGRGVFSSLARSARLTRGHGWKIFGLMLLMYFCNAIVDSPIDQALSGIPAFAGHVIWNGVWSAFYAILAVVTYHDLRVAKEGVDIEQIAAVFE